MSTIRIFKHYLRVPFLLLALAEAVIFFVSVYAGAYLRFGGEFSFAIAGGRWPLWSRAFAFALAMVLSMAAMGHYQAERKEGILNVMLRLSVSYLTGAIALALTFYLIPQLYLGRGVFLFAVTISLMTTSIARVAFLNTVDSSIFKRRVLVYGAGDTAARINALRQQCDRQGFNLVGFVHVPGEHDVMQSGEIIHLNNAGLLKYARAKKVDEIVVAVNDRRKNFPLGELLDCRLSGIDVIEATTFLERETGTVNIACVHPSWMIFSDGFRRGSLRSYLERTFDVVVSASMLVLLSPILGAGALAVWLECGGQHPVLYRQKRVGQGGVIFELLKFRSMRVDAEKDGVVQWARQNDDRITRVGRVMRKYRIDELPQLINILRGTMSLVGPRPERPEFVKGLSERIPYYNERHRMKPGIAGWAQMKYPYGSSENDAIEKLQYDLYYVKNHSLFLDLYILLQTTEVVLFGKGAR